MKVAIIHSAKFPVKTYGGTERAIWWLCKGLNELGHQVHLVCEPDSFCPYATTHPLGSIEEIESKLFDIDILHFFNSPSPLPKKPYVVTIEGNGKQGELFERNTIFVSKNHAIRHSAEAFVYNGLDPDEYKFSTKKSDELTFLAKASWNVKNVAGAIKLAKESEKTLHILGGKKLIWQKRGNIHWQGMIGGELKASFLARSQGLLFPVLWDEPFGIAMIEAMVSGTPVLGTAFGSLPEVIAPETGKICHNQQDFIEGIESLSSFNPQQCRDHVLEKFHYKKMAQSYLKYYEQVLNGAFLNTKKPIAQKDNGCLYPAFN